MVLKSVLEDLKYIDTGEVDWGRIKRNFQNIQDTINTNADDLNAVAKRQTYTIIYAIEKIGITEILKSGKHLRMKIINGWAQLGDNVKESISVSIEDLTDMITFKETEKAGKVRIFKINHSYISFIDNVRVYTSSDRRILVGLTLESVE